MRRVVCAHDCGLVVNPNALRNQIEGGIVQTLSRALHEEVQFDESRVTSVDWATYPILKFPEAPSVEVILVERRDQPLWGGGEASTVTSRGGVGERRVRRYRRAAAARAVHRRAREGGAGRSYA